MAETWDPKALFGKLLRSSSPCQQIPSRLRDNVFYDTSMHIRQAEITSAETVGELLVVDAELIEDRGPEIVDGERLIDGIVTEFVSGAEDGAGLEAAAGHPEAEAVGVVVTSVATLREWRAAEFANRDNRLWPGAFVDVAMTARVLRGAVVVPQATVVQTARGPQVYVVQDGKATVQPVQVLYAQGEDVAVTGVEAGARIVLGTEATPERIGAEQPDAIVLATGAATYAPALL